MKNTDQFQYKRHVISVFLFLLLICHTVLGRDLSSADSTIRVEQDSCTRWAVFGPAKRETSASISFREGDDLRNNSIYSIGNSLYGMIPGLNVIQKFGEPGANDPQFLIRGVGTFGNENAPLVIIDGFERKINSIAIEDIETFSVLKDASAAALYGYKAANGVILITTKRGAPEKTKISIDFAYGFQQPMGLPEFVSSADYADMYNQALFNDGLPILYSTADIENYKAGNSIYYPNVDWMSEMLRKSAPQTRINASAKGGNKIVQYYASVGYFLNEGIYDHTNGHEGYSTNIKQSNLNFRSNLDINLMEDWKMQFDIFGVIGGKNAPYRNDAVWTTLNRYSSMVPMYVQDGKLGGTASYPSNPMSLINEQGYSETQNRYIQTNLSTEYDFRKIIKGLKAGLRFAYDNYYSVMDGWTRSVESFSFLPDHTLSDPYGKKTNLTYASPSNNDQSIRFNFEGYLDYQIRLDDNNQLSALLLYHQDKLTLGSQTPYQNQSLSGLLGYKLMDRYTIDLGLNYGGVESFKKNDRFSLFPSIAAGWIISNESFLRDSKTINYLKLRASVGKTGRSNFSERFAYREYYYYNGEYYFGTGGSTLVVVEADLANPDMTFEKTTSYEAGFDTRLLNDIRLSASYFYQKRDHILVPRENVVPSTVGTEMQPVNLGKAERQGIDFAVSYDKSYKDWGFSVGLNGGWVTSKVLYNAELPVPAGSEYNYATNQPIFQPFGLEFIGFFESQADIDRSPIQQFGTVKPGDMKYRDKNGDGVVDKYDQAPVAKSVYPELELGFTFGFKFKGFDLHGLLHAQLGRYIYLGDNSPVYWPLINDAKISTYVDIPWTEQNKRIATYPRLTTQANPNNYRSSDFWYKKADFLRLRSLEFGYTIPLSRTNDSQKIRIFFLGTNLFTVSNFKYSDPETYKVGYPAMKTYNLGLNLQF